MDLPGFHYFLVVVVGQNDNYLWGSMCDEFFFSSFTGLIQKRGHKNTFS
jgi:hypothetical protein